MLHLSQTIVEGDIGDRVIGKRQVADVALGFCQRREVNAPSIALRDSRFIQVPDVTYQAAFRLIEHATQSKAGLLRNLE